MLRSSLTVVENNNNELIGFIASTVETLRDDIASMRDQMATKDDLARLDGRLSERIDAVVDQMATKEDLARSDGRFTERLAMATTSIRGDIEQIQLRLDSMEHSIASNDERFEGELSRLRSAVYLLGKGHPRCSASPWTHKFLSTNKTDDMLSRSVLVSRRACSRN